MDTDRNRIGKYKIYYLMLLPIVVYYIIFMYIPIAGISIAFFDYNVYQGISGSEFVGFKWFSVFLTDPRYWNVFKNTAIISIYKMIFVFPAPIIFALMVNECRHIIYKRWVQTVSYLPHFLSWTIIAGLTINFLSPSIGIVNQILKVFGVDSIYFMATSSYTRSILVLTDLWKEVGWSAILYMAALTTISPELYESAKLDGAGRFQQIRHITLPGISAIVVMTLILNISNLFNVGFEQVYNLVIPPTYETGQVISTYIYELGLRNAEYGQSTAIGLSQSLMALTLLIVANKIAKKFNEDGAIW